MLPDNDTMNPQRRLAILKGGLAAAALVLTGCGSSITRSRGLPGPVWPDRVLAKSPNRFDVAAGRLECPRGVKPRSLWTREGVIASRANRMVAPNRVTVHHDGMPPVTMRTEGDVRNRLNQVRNAHVNGNGWADIGYHFAVDPLGNVWEGRPLYYQGAHVKNQNPRNVGVLVLGHFDQQSPTPLATAALDSFLAALMLGFDIRMSRVGTHQELAATACPGRAMQRHMEQTRRRGGGLDRALRPTVS